MKTLKLLFLVLVSISLHPSCSSQNNTNHADQTAISEDEVTVYYFHFERRCLTCKAVESVTEEALSELYAGAVPFRAVNLDDEEGKETARKLGVSSQSLLIVKGDERIDLTAEAFMSATSKPEELKKILKEKIDPLVR
ncbi:MAG: nitrophenyl compound nitroreductase subunit ArsF family protein [Bacteroidales bacterium]|nr:nitrophenyl compound nitroreductase subunit ArsF family protein [Bacteroidales bacterium]